ncbi:MAG: hypothetical protein RSA29_17810 [Clostridium sp.]|uniref:hypothetical protein n=1 Tax=Clostridium sp. TaxID=1506 RepID=UPI0030239694
MNKNDIITYLNCIRDTSKDEDLSCDVIALTVALNAIVALDKIKKNLVQIEAPNTGDSYIDDSLNVINNVFNGVEQ